MANFVHTTPNGTVLILIENAGKVSFMTGEPVNRTGVFQFLLKNSADKTFNEKVLKWLEQETAKAQARFKKQPEVKKV
jgi:hypothetical protein